MGAVQLVRDGPWRPRVGKGSRGDWNLRRMTEN